MKILHVIDSGGLYGAERMLLSLMEEQARTGLTPILCSIREKGGPEKAMEVEAREKGIAVTPFPMRSGPNLAGALEIIRFARLEDADLFHSHGYKANILLGFLPRVLRRVPLVTTLHGWTSTRGFGKMRLYEWLDGKSIGFCDAVVVVHPAMLSHPRIAGRKGLKLHCVNNGIPSSGPSASDEGGDAAIRSFFGGSFAIGTAGRLSREKGHAILIEAVRRLLHRGIDARLAITGEGPERCSLEATARCCKMSEAILFTGYRKDVRALLACLDVFVLPSLTEGLPLVILEAMEAGVPIVATRVGGVPGTLEDGQAGVLVPPGDAVALEEGLSYVRDHQGEARLLARRARSLFQERHSVESMTMGYTKVYESVLGRSAQVK